MDKIEQYRLSWRNYLLGENWNPENENSKETIKSLEKMAVLSPQSNDNSEVVVFPPFHVARILAISYNTKGTIHYKNSLVKNKIFEEMEAIHHLSYNMNTPKDDWWQVQIGSPLQILDILFLMYDEFTDINTEIEKWTNIILNMQDAYGLISRGQEEGGANLMWKCQVHFLCGILRREQELIDRANNWLESIITYSNTMSVPSMGKLYADGFFKDGSFIQHYMFSYTGGYGKHLFIILSGLLFAFRDSDLIALNNDKKELFYKFVHDTYEPLLYKGNFMDLSRGREVSRYFGQDNMIGRFIIRALCYLSQTMPEDEKLSTIALIKEQLKNDIYLFKDEFARGEYYLLPSLAEVYDQIMSTDVLPRGELMGHYNFGIVSKPVHLTKDFAFAISMYSKNIACYEYLNGESNKFWHVSDGMTYLYTNTDANQYHNDYYATVDMQRLAGTTVDRSPNREHDSYFNWYLPEAKNVYAFAGGATLDNIGSAGIQYRGQGNGKERNLEVKKSWFMFDDKVVCLGSGISSPTDNPIETIIDNRRLNGGELVITTNNKKVDSNNYSEKIHSLHFCENESNIGYYFPKETNVNILKEHREGTWNSIEINPENKKENDFSVFYIPHGISPTDASYTYAILPNFTLQELNDYVKKPDLEIIENTPSAHAIRKDNIVCVNFWNENTYTCTGITSNTQCCLIVKNDDYIDIAISDPTKNDTLIELDFNFNAKSIVNKDSIIEIISLAPLKITADTKNKDGESLVIKLIK